MNYNFVEYIRGFDWYAVLDLIILTTILSVLVMFFSYKRNLRVLALIFAVIILEVLVLVLSELAGEKEVLTIARYIMHYVVIAIIVMTIIVYQNDIRSWYQKIGNPKGQSIFSDSSNSDDELRQATGDILSACQDMAKQDTGAIIIIDTNSNISSTILDSGTMLNAKLSAALLESIFNTKAPLHDGAVIVRGNKIIAAGCFLPLTQRNVNKELGTRHRAAIGVTEEMDVLAIVISEETGIISVVKKGEIRRYMTLDKLKDEIEEAYGISANAIARRQAESNKKGRF